MMDGLECSEILLRELERTTRIDSEFYSRENLQVSDRLKSYYTQPITENFYVSDGNHMSVSDDFREDGVPYYRGQDIYNTFIESASPICISENYYYQQNMERSHLQKNDILLSIVGAIIGNTSMVYSSRKATCSCKLAIIRPKDKAFKSFLVNVFLKSKYGQNQIQKFRRGTAQTGFLLEDMEQLLVPAFGEVFGNQIQNVMEQLHKLITKSQEIYKSAESLLLSSLNLNNFTPSTENTSIKTFSQVDKSERMDADYYHLKYDELLQRLHAHADKIIKVKDIRTENRRGVQPNYIENGEIAVVNSKNILENGLDYEGFSSTSLTLWKLKPEAHIKQGDILIYTTGANVGRAATYRLDTPALASNHVNILRVKHPHPQYIAFVINSMIGRMQTERLSTGSAQQELYPKDIDSFIIPLVSEETQVEIESLLDKSYALREQSKSLLKAATRAVEIAIEQDESTATAYLEEQTKGDA